MFIAVNIQFKVLVETPTRRLKKAARGGLSMHGFPKGDSELACCPSPGSAAQRAHEAAISSVAPLVSHPLPAQHLRSLADRPHGARRGVRRPVFA